MWKVKIVFFINFGAFTIYELCFSSSVLLLTTAVCVFGAKAHTEAYAGVMAEPNSINPLFDWSFWVGVGAAGMSLISSILYFCVGRRDEIY